MGIDYSSFFMRCGGPVAEEVICDFEARVGRRLPVEYRELLLACGGGTTGGEESPSYVVFDVEGFYTDYVFSIEEIWGFGEGAFSLEDMNEVAVETWEFDPRVLYFAVGPSDMHETLSINYDHPDFAPGTILYEGSELGTGFVEVAGSFGEFLDRLVYWWQWPVAQLDEWERMGLLKNYLWPEGFEDVRAKWELERVWHRRELRGGVGVSGVTGVDYSQYFWCVHGGVSEELLAGFEQECGRRLPVEFRDLLLTCGGGGMFDDELRCYVVLDGVEGVVFGCGEVFGLGHEGENLANMNRYWEWGSSERRDPRLLYFCRGGFDRFTFLAINYGHPDFVPGAVVFHDLYGDGGLVEVAGSFGEFLEGLLFWWELPDVVLDRWEGEGLLVGRRWREGFEGVRVQWEKRRGNR